VSIVSRPERLISLAGDVAAVSLALYRPVIRHSLSLDRNFAIRRARPHDPAKNDLRY